MTTEDQATEAAQATPSTEATKEVAAEAQAPATEAEATPEAEAAPEAEAVAEAAEDTPTEEAVVEATADTSSAASTADTPEAEVTPTESAPETAEAAPETAASEAAPEAAASGNAAVVAEGPTAPEGVSPAQELTPEELVKHSPALAPIIAAMQDKTPINGKVIGWNKGGFHVSVDGLPAFCPKSQMEIGNPKQAHAYVDRDLQFSVAEVKENGKRIVVHRKGLLRQQRGETIQALKERSNSGEAISGKVTSVTDFGAFVDLGGVEGLVHLSQLSRTRVEKPSDAVKVGQEVQVKVLKVEKGGDRISLSMKALEPDPWLTADDTFEIGGTFTGKVVRATDFGLFVDVGHGIEGLLHSSQLEMRKSMSDYPEGSEVTGWIREVDGGRRRLSLSLREVAKGNPWQDIESRFEEGQQIEGVIEQVAKFGVFVVLQPGLSGLLPFSATQSMGDHMRPQRMYTPGDTINIQIDAIDAKRKRISLAPVGSKLEGTKSDLRDYQKTAEPTTGLSAMAAAFAKLQGG